jgi:putative ABC transport system permease protein
MNFWLKWGGNVKRIKSQLVYNLKKDKESYISFGIVVLITAIMLNLALVLVFQVDRAYDNKFEDLETATINVCIPQIQDTDTLREDVKGLEGVSEVECREAVFLEAVVKDFRGTDFSMNTVFYNKDEFRDMNKLDIKEESAESTGESIYLPLYVASFGKFGIGDKIIYEIGDRKHTFLISGVLEEMQYGNYGKGLMGAYLPKSVYEEFASEYEQHMVTEYSIIANDNTEINFLNNEISNLLEEKNITMLTSCDKASTKDTRIMVCDLLILVLLAFALVILLVSVFLCKFRIRNSIEEDMVNMGVLKALGYTGNMIIGSVVLPYLMVTLIASLLGVIASYGILPSLSELLTLQAGFSFGLLFDIKGFICVEIILVFIVTVFTYAAAKRIRKLQPINAIRGNSGGKAIKKNYFPLEETHGNAKLLLVLKLLFSNGKQNALLFGVFFVLTILIAFASTLFYNVIVKPNNFISTLSEEIPEIIIYPKEQYEAALLSDLQSDSEIKTVLKYTMGTVNIDDVPVTVFACEDFSKVSNDLCYLGENPNEKNEIALGSAFEGKYKLGEQIEIQNGDVSCSYEITGFVQSVNYQGNVCEFSMEGYAALNSETIVPSLYVYLQDWTDVERYIEEIEESYGDTIFNQVNYQKMTETTQEMYSGITSIIVIVIFVLTILIALFVLYIVIKTLLVQRKQELGIYKAIGYSNWQLMVQLMGSFLPSSVLAVLLSSGLGLIYVPQINRFIFQTIGAVKNNMEVSFTFLMIFALIQIVVNLIISILLIKPIKKISAYALIKEN